MAGSTRRPLVTLSDTPGDGCNDPHQLGPKRARRGPSPPAPALSKLALELQHNYEHDAYNHARLLSPAHLDEIKDAQQIPVPSVSNKAFRHKRFASRNYAATVMNAHVCLVTGTMRLCKTLVFILRKQFPLEAMQTLLSFPETVPAAVRDYYHVSDNKGIFDGLGLAPPSATRHPNRPDYVTGAYFDPSVTLRSQAIAHK
ncbi:hypothetical protein H9P43_006077 [Blastocladiella emersonii ATCC 22665]|nr:hypothetical protein H9P43_006077 [Blastocladiella emersonii ATCC 22665]